MDFSPSEAFKLDMNQPLPQMIEQETKQIQNITRVLNGLEKTHLMAL